MVFPEEENRDHGGKEMIKEKIWQGFLGPKDIHLQIKEPSSAQCNTERAEPTFRTPVEHAKNSQREKQNI